MKVTKHVLKEKKGLFYALLKLDEISITCNKIKVVVIMFRLLSHIYKKQLFVQSSISRASNIFFATETFKSKYLRLICSVNTYDRYDIQKTVDECFRQYFNDIYLKDEGEK